MKGMKDKISTVSRGKRDDHDFKRHERWEIQVRYHTTVP